MTIDEYKQKLISVVQNMEREHGCEIGSVKITVTTFGINEEDKIYNVEIEM